MSLKAKRKVHKFVIVTNSGGRVSERYFTEDEAKSHFDRLIEDTKDVTVVTMHLGGNMVNGWASWAK